MPAWLSISLLLGGIAVALRAGVALGRVMRAGRQRRHDRRSARDVKAFVKSRMGKTETLAGSRPASAKPVDTREATARILNLHRPRGDSQ